MTYSDGAIYEGEWINNKRGGKGTMAFRTGARYQGTWKDDLMHGNGVLTCKGETSTILRYEGDYLDGNRHGRVRMIYGKVVVD